MSQRSVAYDSVFSLQKRCLQILSPPVTKHEPPTSGSAKVEKAKATAGIEKKKEKSKLVRGGSVSKQQPITINASSGKPPSRRIQRPTSIRRPTLIGKSVEGAAMQAMAASRARASVTRGSSPFQKNAKVAPKKEVHTGDHRAKASAASSIAKVESIDEGQQIDTQSTQSQGALTAEASRMLKAYKATMSLTSASSFHHSRIVQALVDRYWIAKPEQPLSPSVRDFLLTRSVRLWSTSCVLFGFPDRMMNNVSTYFAQWLKVCNPEFSLLQLDAPSQSASILSTSSTVMVELKRINHRKLCVVLRTSLKYKSETKEPTLRCDAWMLLTCVGEDVAPSPPRRRLRNRKPVKSFEREATLVDKKVCGFAVSFNEYSLM